MDSFDSHQLLDLVSVGVLIAASAFFAAADTAISSMGHHKAETLYSQRKGKSNNHLRLWLDFPSQVLATISLFNNLFKLAAAAWSTVLASQYFPHQSIWIATGIVTFLVVIFGELIPKSYARAHAESFGVSSLFVVYLFYKGTRPVVYLFAGLSELIAKLFGIKTQPKPQITEGELEYIIQESEKTGVIEDTKKDMISGIFEFDATKVREIMTPRTDMEALIKESTINDALSKIIETGHSRLPVYEERIDNIIGVIFAKDLLRYIFQKGEEVRQESILPLMREAFFIPESNPLMEVFQELNRAKNHLAIVIDEYGGTAGMVTMEDILEEIVGEIQDEYDSEEEDFVKVGTNTVDIAGSVNIYDFTEYFQLDEDFEKEVDGEVDTVAGWITKLLGDLPEVGQTVAYGNLTMEVTKVDRHRIERIRVIKTESLNVQ